MNLPYLATRRRLRDYRTAVIAGLARKLDKAGDQVPPCRHGASPSRPCPGCAERSAWHAAARLARGEAAKR